MRKSTMAIIVVALVLFSTNGFSREREVYSIPKGPSGVIGSEVPDMAWEQRYHGEQFPPQAYQPQKSYRSYPTYIGHPPKQHKRQKYSRPVCKIEKTSYYKHGKHYSVTKRVCRDKKGHDNNRLSKHHISRKDHYSKRPYGGDERNWRRPHKF